MEVIFSCFNKCVNLELSVKVNNHISEMNAKQSRK